MTRGNGKRSNTDEKEGVPSPKRYKHQQEEESGVLVQCPNVRQEENGSESLSIVSPEILIPEEEKEAENGLSSREEDAETINTNNFATVTGMVLLEENIPETQNGQIPTFVDNPAAKVSPMRRAPTNGSDLTYSRSEFLAEAGFSVVLEQEAPVYYEKLVQRNWVTLLRNSEDFFIAPVVREFYSSMRNVNMEGLTFDITIQGEDFVISLELISLVLNIPILENAPFSPNMSVEDICCGLDIVATPERDGGIKAQNFFRNQLLVFRWIVTNVVPTSHYTTAYLPSLYLLYVVQRDLGFCICRWLFQTLVNHMGSSSSLPLPCFVTSLVLHVAQSRLSVENLSKVFIRPMTINILKQVKQCKNGDWTPNMIHEEDRLQSCEEEPLKSPVTTYEENIFENDSFIESVPKKDKTWVTKLWTGLKKVADKFEIMERKQDEILDGFKKVTVKLENVERKQDTILRKIG
ncbi:hypothetical protein FRX31_029095 [Thalictrum thalictroides]|uniref:Putative plant transposon protein domain-containing protein n=1 Tax=Thalictrum thalictroides TaxID=46969 RepID=A0A7J6VAS6_THATH|nr:hypothetical protein FRX31_029095 [Thalictrum thalictroides]